LKESHVQGPQIPAGESGPS